jgi:hypothetical protein
MFEPSCTSLLSSLCSNTLIHWCLNTNGAHIHDHLSSWAFQNAPIYLHKLVVDSRQFYQATSLAYISDNIFSGSFGLIFFEGLVFCGGVSSFAVCFPPPLTQSCNRVEVFRSTTWQFVRSSTNGYRAFPRTTRLEPKLGSPPIRLRRARLKALARILSQKLEPAGLMSNTKFK